MKHSKIILSVTTCLLGIAVFVATKANQRTLRLGCTKGSGDCNQQHAVRCNSVGNGPKCRIAGATVYTCTYCMKALIVTGD